MNTSIIISNLQKTDFQSSRLSLVDRIKIKVLNVHKDKDEDYFINRIVQWSNIPFLNRVVIIMKDETSSKELYGFLQQMDLRDDIKISLQENLLSRSKSFDDDDNLSTKGLRRFKDANMDYQEPEPKKLSSEDLSKLGYLDRETLFTPDKKKPSLSVNTDTDATAGGLGSPSITLDKTE